MQSLRLGAKEASGPYTKAEGYPKAKIASFHEMLRSERTETDAAAEFASTVHPFEAGAYGEQMQNAMSERNLEGGLLLLCMLISHQGKRETIEALAERLHKVVGRLTYPDREIIRRALMNAAYAPCVLDEINGLVFDNGGSGRFPYEDWKPCTPVVTGSVAHRSPEQYRDVIDQFAVEGNARYESNKKGKNETYGCTFVWDVMCAMEAPIPPCASAEKMRSWLEEKGQTEGWQRVTEEEAQLAANQGLPTIAVYVDVFGRGFAQVICPSRDHRYHGEMGAALAQAEHIRTSYAHTSQISGAFRAQEAFYVHD